MKKLRNNEATGDEEDSFSPLPDDLLVSILSKLKDLKDIFMSSLVCKRFASLVTHIQTICLTCPAREIKPLTNPNMNFITFLEKFKKLESIYLEFTCPRNNTCSHWKGKYETKRGIIDSFVCELFDSVVNQHHEEEQENQQHRFCSTMFMFQSVDHGFKVFVRCFDCVRLLSILVQRLGSLKRVSVKQGKMILEEEQLVMWRKSLVSKQQVLDLSFVNLSCSWIALPPNWSGDGMLFKIVVQPEDVAERNDFKYELGGF